MTTPNKTYQYLLKLYGTDEFINISDYVGDKASGGEQLNQLPESIKFTVDDPKNDAGDYIDIASDSEIVIAFDDSYTIPIAWGKVEDPGRKLKSWDWNESRPIYSYDLIIEQIDFSGDPINNLSYTNTLLSTILDDLFSYSNDTLGGSTLVKYRLNITDFTVKSFTADKIDLRSALTDLCKQYNLKWSEFINLNPDTTNLIKIERTIDIFDKSGISLTEGSTWTSGISNDNVKFGSIINPYDFLSAKYPDIAAEYDFNIKEDKSIIVNHLELEANIYISNNTEDLHRWTEQAKPNTFIYYLDGIAASITYVAFLISTGCLTGSTSTVVRIPSIKASTIEAGNIARVINAVDELTYTLEDFREVQSVNIIDSEITEITLVGALSFTPAINYIFEIVSNVEIFEDNQTTYEDQGVTIELSKSQDARLRFLDLSEPPPGVTIVCYYKKIQPYRIEAKHGDSKARYGTKYKFKKIDDDIFTTRDELQGIANSALIPYPNFILEFKSDRPEKLKAGASLPVSTETFPEQNFVVTRSYWQDTGGINFNRDPAIKQEITMMTVLEDTDSILNNFENSRKTTVTSEKKEINYQNEDIKVNDGFTWYKIGSSTLYDFDTNANTVFYLKFQDGSGTNLADNTVNNNDFTISNAFYSWIAAGFPSDTSALYIDNNPFTNANYGYLNDNNTLDITDQITMECIIKFKTFRDAEVVKYNVIFSKYQTADGLDGDDGTSFIFAYNNSTSELYMEFFDTTTTDSSPIYLLLTVSGVSLSLSTFYYFQFSYDPTNELYNISINGVNQTVAQSGTITVSAFASIFVSIAQAYLGNLRGGSAPGINVNADIEFYRIALHSEYRTSFQAYTTAQRFGLA